MRQPVVRRSLGLVQAALLLTGGMALADGAPSTATVHSSAAAYDPVVARVSFQCKGGVRVDVTRRTKTVRVDFAGQARTVELNRSPSGTSARNAQVTWVTQSQGSYMRNNSTGQLELSGCRPVKG